MGTALGPDAPQEDAPTTSAAADVPAAARVEAESPAEVERAPALFEIDVVIDGKPIATVQGPNLTVAIQRAANTLRSTGKALEAAKYTLSLTPTGTP